METKTTNPKYTFNNGMLVNNAQRPVNNHIPLAIVSSPQDILNASEIQQKAIRRPIQVPESVVAAIERVQGQDFLNQYELPENLDGSVLLDQLTEFFTKYEVPLGFLHKLIGLTEYELNFIIDDSGSMMEKSDTRMKDACEYMPKKHGIDYMSRWQEVENRLHIMMDFLAFIPVPSITISFLNRKDKYSLDHKGKTPKMFKEEVHQLIKKLFKKSPEGGTPIFEKLVNAFSKPGKVKHFLFTDGEPDNINGIKNLVLNRKNPKSCPLTFMSCTGDDEKAEWMKGLEEIAPYVAEIDDFVSERKEVLKKQGDRFPYSYGFWILSQLVADLNPDDLDALDDTPPLTKKTLNEILGRKISNKEYQSYFNHHPSEKKYRHLSEQFKREDVVAREIFMFDIVLATKSSSTLKNLAEISKKHHENPILVKDGKTFYIYGRVENQWRLVNFNTKFNQILSELPFPKQGKKSRLMTGKWKRKEIYILIAEMKGHVHIPKSIDYHYSNTTEGSTTSNSDLNSVIDQPQPPNPNQAVNTGSYPCGTHYGSFWNQSLPNNSVNQPPGYQSYQGHHKI